MLIDTGASASSISTEIAEREFPEFIEYSPFTVSTAHGKTYHNFIIQIPSLQTFQAPNQIHKFNIFDFSKNYDGIIGLKLLQQLNAIIDIKNKVLRTDYTTIPIYFEDCTYTIGPRERKIIKVPVRDNLANIVINHQVIQRNVEIPETLTRSEDYHAITECVNFNDYPVQITLEKPLTTEVLEEITYDTNEALRIPPSKLDKMLKENVINKVRTQHLNKEERTAILTKLLEYKDVCHDDRLPLTFTSEIKHTLNLKDEIPIYQRPYRKPPIQKQQINKEVEKLLAQDIIQESCSPLLHFKF